MCIDRVSLWTVVKTMTKSAIFKASSLTSLPYEIKEVGQMRMGDQQVDHWRTHGYVVVEKFLTGSELERARAELYGMFPTSEKYAADPAAFPEVQQGQWIREFPLPAPTINRISTHPDIVSFVERVLGTRDLLMTQSQVWAKYGIAGDFHDQPLHFDWDDNSLVVPAEDLEIEQVPAILYYEDVTADLGPTYVLSKQHYQEMPFVMHTTDRSRDWNKRPRSHFPELYEYERAVTVPAGSILFFSMSTLHRGSRFASARGARFSHHLVYRNASCHWMGWQAWPRFAISEDLRRFVQEATPRARDVIGFPPVGHRYWTPKTLDQVAARYPGIDMTPYRAGACTDSGGT